MFDSRWRYIPLTNGADTLVLSRSSLRYGLLLSLNVTNPTYLSIDPMTAVGTGFPISAYSGCIYLCARDHGDAVLQELHAWATAASTVIGVLEIMACDCESRKILTDALGDGPHDARVMLHNETGAAAQFGAKRKRY